MLALLIGTGVGAVVLVVGLVLAVRYSVHPTHHSPTADGAGSSSRTAGTAATDAASHPSRTGSDPRDVLAGKPMPAVGEDASHPAPVSTHDPGKPILVPTARGTGVAQVPTGFPHTPAGALAQLSAIDQVAMQSGSLRGAREVIAGWAQPGGPTTSTWSVIQGLATLFEQTGLSGGGSPQLAIVLTPLMGQIKGVVGPDFVVPCIDFELDITLQQTARAATADCQRMVWTADPTLTSNGRWMIGPGSEPATPPSVWPDTDPAISVGYRDLRQEH